jgi:hypothetical protein
MKRRNGSAPPEGYFSRSYIPLRQRVPLKRDFIAKDTVYSLFLRGVTFFVTKESNQRNSAKKMADPHSDFELHCGS